MITSPEALKSLAGGFMPQEEMLEVAKKKSRVFIGIPRETSFQEKRVALLPQAVALLVNNGHEVVVESGAGNAADFTDNDYSEAGATITQSTEEVYKADILLKVAPPSFEEIDLMQRNQTLISALQLTVQHKDFLRKLMNKKVSAIAWDYIKDNQGIYPIVRAMGEIAGNTAVLIAGEDLSNVNNGQGLMFGGISGVAPTEVVILGAGTVGEFATRASLGLGASVKIFDNSTYKLNRIQNDIGVRLYTSTIQPDELKKALSTADVAIGAIRASRGRTPCVVSEDMVSEMKKGAVIVDVSIDQGGCFETSEVCTHEHPTFTKYGVTHYCVPNIASRVAKTASFALSNIFAPVLMSIGDEGGVENLLKRDTGVRHGIYLYKGVLTNRYLGETFKLPYKDLELLLMTTSL
jgi:alanine dehydrogenase